jgi:hypothetical protein
MSRLFLSDRFKTAVRRDPRSQAALATLASLTYVQMSCFMHDRVGIGPTCQHRLVRLGAELGLPASQCFREVAL